MKPRLYYDDVAWEWAEAIANAWFQQFFDPKILQSVAQFLKRHHGPGDVDEFTYLEKGSYNITFQMKNKNASSTVIRFVQPGSIMFPEEKVRNEVAMMRYINDQTAIPVPFRGILNPDISEARLEALYGDVATVLLKLPKPDFLGIGSLKQVDDFTWEVTNRPLSMPMNTLAELHFTHLTNQRNDAIDSADECPRKLVARYLFRKLAREPHLTKPAEDCRVVYWEFTYAAPVEFSFALPFEYQRRLPTFLEAIRAQEDRAIEQDCWASGDFWIAYAARNNFAFDLIYSTRSISDFLDRRLLPSMMLGNRDWSYSSLQREPRLNKLWRLRLRDTDTAIGLASGWLHQGGRRYPLRK
ncbi:hypothetical protein BO83DRAFT_447611 [Aspergillus eucalypticola CBS 122712]|uniref:Aminoglycoside phosphotransferase domain-containing protein n=1 Tax=Aspergillus eucalypticola (strain CBS 122712 / IBT 29274) TaxID=1448314 RepID=A0A317V9C9_ASPEC|nr:uncharacterized protein BO83DRAFT_447611 [Aspergillus eucalypticola CBS 122712]PWY70766.1 hypothetical protein BO83DRAFT_447611 [Aspergillus eucalypticola CBS 122712]